ncbi:MAG TPA: AI-2E family transporter, partial [Candidatus Binatia bacterium]|nr:AI-2E family transporter [Candidatus Binatia bacterium]
TLIVGAFAIGVIVVLLLAPVLIQQITALIQDLPSLLATARERIAASVTPFTNAFAPPLDQLATQAVEQGGRVVLGVLGRGAALVNVASLLAITPLVSFYLLRDWPRIVDEIDDWLPRAHAETIRQQARAIDEVLAGFVRGSAIVCSLLAAFYAIALTIVGLDFGLVIGLVAGGLSFVPYLGFVVGLLSSVGMAVYQFWPEWIRIAVVLAIFFVGQWGTDYFLTPRLVGKRANVHPLWILFSVFAGGAVFGFVGVLLAVPACAAIGVLVRFAIARYKTSRIYLGP